MDLIVIIVNSKKVMSKIKSYLKEAGLGQPIVISSSGTSAIRESYNDFKTTTGSTLGMMTSVQDEGQTIVTLNKDPERTQEYLDRVAGIFGQATKAANSGIAFSIPVNELFGK